MFQARIAHLRRNSYRPSTRLVKPGANRQSPEAAFKCRIGPHGDYGAPSTRDQPLNEIVVMCLRCPIVRYATGKADRWRGRPIHLPNRSGTVIVAPHHIVFMVAIEISRSDHVPVVANACEELGIL